MKPFLTSKTVVDSLVAGRGMSEVLLKCKLKAFSVPVLVAGPRLLHCHEAFHIQSLKGFLEAGHEWTCESVQTPT